MLPYHVVCSAESCLLYELKDGRFQIMTGVPSAPLIVGFQFILANHELVSFLKALKIPRVSYAPAIIWDAQRQTELTTHHRLKIGQCFDYDHINDLDLDGHRLLVMGESHLFVSPSLKRALEGDEFGFLRFSEGLSKFAGSAANQ